MLLEKGISTGPIGQDNSFQGVSMLMTKMGNIVGLILRYMTIQGGVTRPFTGLDYIPQGKSMTSQDM